jgi:DNA modification methylase
MPDGCVQMVWTDPPYGHGNMDNDLQAARVRDQLWGARVRAPEPILNDREEEYEPLIDGVMTALPRVLDPDCCCCCCAGGGGPSPAFGRLALRMDEGGMVFFHAVVWDKSARGDGMGWRYRRNYEFVMVSHRRGGRLRWNDDHPAVANVFRDHPVRERVHPNEKPVSLVRRFIRAHTSPGDLILDPFAGSGTTGVAAIAEGRRAILVEKDPAYADVCRRRVAEAMGLGRGSLLAATVQPSLFGGES